MPPFIIAGACLISVFILPQCSDPDQSPEKNTNSGRAALEDKFMKFVAVEHKDNGDDDTGFGDVSYPFEIGKYPVTNAQYTKFLNAVARTDPHRLFERSMEHSPHGGILRRSSSGGYSYEVKPGMENKPVVFISWFDAARFCNWLHNDRPSGEPGTSTTEDGTYKLEGTSAIALPGTDPEHGPNGRNAEGRYFLPSENEWYKAAYFQPSSAGGDSDGYWLYPTSSNEPPSSEAPPGAPRSANFGGILSTITDVGAYPNSPGFYGTYGQAGNVWEWNEQVIRGSLRGVRGGSWLNASTELKATARATGGPGFGSGDNGFRVARRKTR